jgi:subtilase family serine protease
MHIWSPNSDKYGQQLTKDELDALVANPEGVQATIAFLSGLPGVSYEQNSDLQITATGPISTWDEALNADFRTYEKTKEGKTTSVVRTESYSLPDSIAPYVSTVLNTVQFPVELSHGPVVTRMSGSVASALN